VAPFSTQGDDPDPNLDDSLAENDPTIFNVSAVPVELKTFTVE